MVALCVARCRLDSQGEWNGIHLLRGHLLRCRDTHTRNPAVAPSVDEALRPLRMRATANASDGDAEPIDLPVPYGWHGYGDAHHVRKPYGGPS